VIYFWIEKRGFEVELKNEKLKYEGDREENANGRSFDDGSEGVGIIETRDLRVTLSDNSSFEAWGRCFSVFETEDDFCADNFAIDRSRDEGPCAIGFKRVVFDMICF